MPWREAAPMNERMRFVLDRERELYSMVERCGRYGVSRKTGYTWVARYERDGRTACASEAGRPTDARIALRPTLPRRSARGGGSIPARALRRSCTG